MAKVYPRVCGGTPCCAPVRRRLLGLSPRMRGNPAGTPLGPPNAGSIPAYAGEPARPSPTIAGEWVYPRVCGGTVSGTRGLCCRPGLSPRMRGNRYATRRRSRSRRSIPAYAGEPIVDLNEILLVRVYPRVCGGTEGLAPRRLAVWGLSPRMRGNLLAEHQGELLDGSIPAYAGEPNKLHGKGQRQKVYPRVCGGTPTRVSRTGAGEGLSPRMRGNHDTDGDGFADKGSIPAYAGEPYAGGSDFNSSRVYPRVCGGTF